MSPADFTDKIASMNWLQFISSLVDSLAWPAAIVISIIALRKPISRTLQALTKLKYKDLEFDFGRELSQIEVVAESIEPLPGPGEIVQDADVDDPLLVFEEPSSMPAEFSIAITWRRVERELRNAADRLDMHETLSNLTIRPMKLIRDLTREDVISSKTAQVLQKMLHLRDKSIERSHDEKISPGEVHDYTRLANKMIYQLRRIAPEDDAT